MTRTRRFVLLAAAACHLGLVVACALDYCLWETGPIGKVLTYYGALSGVNTGYSYFAPAVWTPPQAEFTVVDREGRAIADSLATGATREAALRTTDLIDVFQRRKTDDALRRELARTWAAVMFARHPEAESVVLDVGYNRVPSMPDLRRGASPRRTSVYRARIVRSPDAAIKRGQS